MRRAMAVMLLWAALSGCADQPRLQASSAADFELSYSRVTASLDDGESAKFDQALKDIVLNQAGIFGPQLRLTIDPVETSSNAFSAALQNATLDMVERVIPAGIEMGWAANRSHLVVKHAGPLVGGRSAAEIIEFAESERERALVDILAKYRVQLIDAERTMAEVRSEIARAEQRLVEQRNVLKNIVMSNARFSLSTGSFGQEPTISFDMNNGGKISISRVFIRAVLQTPGRAVPWVDDSFNYEFRGGLEPGESRHLDLAPNMFSEWGEVPKDVVDGSILTLNLSAIEDAFRNRIGEVEEDDELTRREEALSKAIQALQAQIAELEAGVDSKG